MKPVSFLSQNWFALAAVLIPAGLFLGLLPHNTTVYYAFMLLLVGRSIINFRQISIAAIILLMVCALSILCGNADPLFRSWERLGLFALLLLAYFPIFRSAYFDRLCSKTFPMMLFVVIFTCIGSFIGYFFGINYMGRRGGESLYDIDTAGKFGGLTPHSMMLGPICAIALTVLVWLLIEQATTKKTRIIISGAAFASFCCMMLSASRSANIAGVAGVVLILFLKYRNRIGKMLQIVIIGALLAVILSPVYMPYANKVLEKQHKNEEAGSTFSSREDRWEHRLQEFSEYPIFGYGFCAIDTHCYGEYMPSTGIVEPGSSWLAILSMTGLVGMACFLALLLPTIIKLYRKVNREADRWALLHLGILAVFLVHFIAEGYVFAAGGALCFLFWFFFGCATAYARNPTPYTLNMN